MDLNALTAEKKERIRTPWKFGKVVNYFGQKQGLSALIEPLVIALQWPGEFPQLIEVLPHFSDEVNLTDFMNIFAELGYNSEQFTADISNISEQLIPVLFLPFDASHGPCIILQYNQDDITVVNDEGEIVYIKYSGLKGIAYHFSQFKEVDLLHKKDAFKGSIMRFKNLGYHMLFLSFLYNVFTATIPIYIMLIYDKVIPSESPNMIISFMAGVIIIVFCSNMINSWRVRFLSYIGARLDKSMGEEIINHILLLPPSMTERNTVGNQVSRIRDFESIRDFFSSPIAMMLFELPFVIIFIGVIYFLSPTMALVPLFLALVFLSMYVFANPIVLNNVKKQSFLKVKKQAFLLETFMHIRDIKETGKIHVWESKYKNMIVDYSRSVFHQVFASSVLNIISEMFMMLAGLTMLAVGAYVAMEEELSLGVLIAIMMLTWKVLSPLKMFFATLPKIRQIISSIGQVNKLFSIPIEKSSNKVIVCDDIKKSKIEFNRVTFKYRNDLPPSLLGASFKAEPGELICITGNNSSGKSTLLKMMLGMYKPLTGSILINNRNLQQYDPVEYRRSIGYLPQKAMIFYGTIMQNILFGNLTAEEHEVEVVTRLLGLYDEIMALPDKFHTRLGDASKNMLSAGFIQKICLARTFLTNSSILLLDEPATNLDQPSGKKLLSLINFYRHETTIFMVSQRPSHFKVSDKLIYINEGQIQLFGKPDAVMDKMPKVIY